jgi:hypothetical protein
MTFPNFTNIFTRSFCRSWKRKKTVNLSVLFTPLCSACWGPAFQTLNRTFKLVFESERVCCDFRNSILTSFFCYFRKVWNRTNSEFSVNSECLETPVFLILTPKPSKTRFFKQKTGNYFQTDFRIIFTKFSRVWKDRIFPKNFRTLKTELFRNSRKQKVQKIPSFARSCT